MNEIEYAKKRYYELKKRRNDLLMSIADEYYFDGDIEDEDGIDDFLEEILSGDITLNGNDDRDLMYLENMMLMFELVITRQNNDAHPHNSGMRNPIINQAIQYKEQAAEDIKKAEEVISAMDEIIAMCENLNN